MNITRSNGSVTTATVDAKELSEIVRGVLEKRGYICSLNFDVIIRFKTCDFSLSDPLNERERIQIGLNLEV